MKKLLLVNRMGIGDVVLTTPLAQLLKETLPCKVGMLVSAKAADILKRHPYIDDVFSHSKAKARSVIADIRSKGYNEAIIIDERLTSTLLAYKAGCRLLNLGLEVTIGKRSFFSRKKRAFRAALDYTDYIRCVAPQIVPKELPPSIGRSDDGSVAKIDGWLQEQQLKPGRFVLIVPKGVASNKNWPVEHFQKLNDLLGQQNIVPVYLGAAGDDEYITAIAGSKINAAGCFTLRELPVLARHAAATLAPCTGSMHIIATAGTPLIALYGPTDPAIWAPAHARVLQADLACVPCGQRVCDKAVYRECMQAITPQQVFTALKAYIKQ